MVGGFKTPTVLLCEGEIMAIFIYKSVKSGKIYTGKSPHEIVKCMSKGSPATTIDGYMQAIKKKVASSPEGANIKWPSYLLPSYFLGILCKMGLMIENPKDFEQDKL